MKSGSELRTEATVIHADGTLLSEPADGPCVFPTLAELKPAEVEAADAPCALDRARAAAGVVAVALIVTRVDARVAGLGVGAAGAGATTGGGAGAAAGMGAATAGTAVVDDEGAGSGVSSMGTWPVGPGGGEGVP